MWTKLKSIFSAKEPREESNKKGVFTKSLPKKENNTDDPAIAFVKGFKNYGGHFIYCENKQEANLALQQILELENIDGLLCTEPEHQQNLTELNIPFTSSLNQLSTFSYMGCESLITNDGSILISSLQTNKHKLNQLPKGFIVVANPCQLVDTIGDALSIIRRAKKNNLPSNITSLRAVDSYAISEKQSNRTVYLLLIED